MNNINIFGKIDSITTTDIFGEELLKIKVTINMKGGRSISTILYSNKTSDNKLVNLEKGTPVQIRAHLEIKKPINSDRPNKEFILMMMESWRITKEEKNLNYIYLVGILSEEPEIQVVNDTKYARFTVKVQLTKSRRKSITVTSRKSVVDDLAAYKVGDKMKFQGYFKPSRHHIELNGEDFDFDTFEVSLCTFDK